MNAKAPPPPTRYPLKRIIAPLSILSYILSLPVLFVAVWLLLTRGYDCEHLLRVPRLRVAVAVALILVFIIGNAVVFSGQRRLLPGALLLAVILVGLMSVGLALIGAYGMESREVPASPVWLRTRVERGETWSNVKKCIFDTRVCDDLAFRTMELTSYDFSLKKLTAIESGCCKPADQCGMDYVNATFWNPPNKSGEVGDGASSNPECREWSNDATQLCFDCDSCKTGFLRTLQGRWRNLGVLLIVMVVVLLTIHSVRFIILMSERYQDE